MSAGENDDGSVTMSSPEEDIHSGRTEQERSDSPTSHLSLKSERSIPLPLNFSDEAQRNTERTKMERSDSPTSHLSLKSERSIPLPLNFSDEAQRNKESTKQEESDSLTSSYLSLKSDRSIPLPLNFSDEAQRNKESTKQEESDSSYLSLKSDRSIPLPLNFTGGAQKNLKRMLSVEDHQEQMEYRPAKKVCQQHSRAPVVFCKTDNMHIGSVCMGQEHQGHSKSYIVKSNVSDSQAILHDIMGKMATQVFKNFKRELSEDYPECLGNQPEELNLSDAAKKIVESFGGEGALRIAFHFLENANPLQKITDANKAKLKNECKYINEGNSSQDEQSLLKEIYTDIYMTEGGKGEINNEHEVLRIEMISQNRTTQEASFSCNDIFKTLPGQTKRVRTVLTMGIVGIGKHVSVQKFILDWADGKTNQDIDIIIHLPFRELNQKKENCSLLQLIHQYAPDLEESSLSKLKVLFILDGLEVCQYPLDFQKNGNCFDIKEKVPVDVLLTNLINGNLISSAQLWITTRPSTANRIPPECVHRVTEIRGFNDNQKEAYFRKKISDQKLASEIITHIKSCRSLYIMCHMPIFCWISATVLENIMSDGNCNEIPKTLTEMFTHFLLIQIKHKHKKFNGADANNPKKLSEDDKKMILKLGKLAFQQMEKQNFVFHEEDLINGDDKVSEYSLFTEIFREELGLYKEKVYSFVHVSYQEYLAAIYAHFACVNDGKNVLENVESTNLSDVQQSAVNKALKSENGHLDLFLRFLLGLSVNPNHNLLQDFLTKGCSSKHFVDKNMTVHYIQDKIKQEQSPERIINLFHCLNELNDNTLVKEIQTAMKSGTLLGSELEPEQWSALAYVLLKSGELLDEFDMKKFRTSTENQLRLLPVLKICKRARLDCCDLSPESCKRIASAFQSINSPLRDLDLRNNELKKSGANFLFTGLESPHCQIHTLKLAGCNLPSTSYTNLASALKSTNSPLRELDLSYNKISENGVKKLCTGLISENCKLQILKLKRCGLKQASCTHLASVLKSSYSHLKELELKSNDLQDSGVKNLSAGLQDPQCRLERLGLSGCMITEMGCRFLALALNSNAGHLRELGLSYNNPGDSGVKLLTAPTCKLEKLNVENGGVCRIKPGLRKYAHQLTVNPNTVHPRLKLSEGNQKISETTEEQKYPDHPERFKLYPQFMCTEALTGRCYFEVECDGGVGVGVTYKTSDRKENIMGVNNTFPALLCLNGKSKLWHDNQITCGFSVIAQSKRIGVYVDLERGSLSYYSIRNDTYSLLHTHHTKFKGPLYTGFIFLPDSSVTLCELT